MADTSSTTVPEGAPRTFTLVAADAQPDNRTTEGCACGQRGCGCGGRGRERRGRRRACGCGGRRGEACKCGCGGRGGARAEGAGRCCDGCRCSDTTCGEGECECGCTCGCSDCTCRQGSAAPQSAAALKECGCGSEVPNDTACAGSAPEGQTCGCKCGACRCDAELCSRGECGCTCGCEDCACCQKTRACASEKSTEGTCCSTSKPEQSHACASGGASELVIHAIPKLVRRAALFAALDAIPVGESLVIVAPHQPTPLFQHLDSCQAHYRVETLTAGPVDWRYRITRLS